MLNIVTMTSHSTVVNLVESRSTFRDSESCYKAQIGL